MRSIWLLVSLLAGCTTGGSAVSSHDMSSEAQPARFVSTYSIVARDKATGQLGVAVQSHWFSVGPIVPWAEAGVGAVATQSLVNVSYGPRGLDLMRAGHSADEALRQLTLEDNAEFYRQVAMVDARGRVAVHTGRKCIPEAQHECRMAPDGSAFACQANMMAKKGVPQAMAAAFEASQGDLASRMLAALEAAEAAGGDIRGRQSAALVVVSGERSSEPWKGTLVELRVEDDPEPLKELSRLLALHRAYQEMNEGDLALEHGDVEGALRRYHAAMALAPDHAEMVFWSAVALANAGRVEESLPLFARAYGKGEQWRELARRLPGVDLLSAPPEAIERILAVPAAEE